MTNNNYQIYFDCGFSKLRAGAFNKLDSNQTFYTESKFLFNHMEIDLEIQKVITFLEKKTNEYIDDVNLMIDSHKMISINISISKKIDESELREEDIQFLVQEAKQLILKHYNSLNITHIIIDNYKVNNIDYDYLPKNIKCNFISLDISFICLPEKIIEYFKNIFYKFDISINQTICSSYAKTMNYKDNFSSHKNISFIDIGFNKTSITTYINDKIVSLSAIPIGGNSITKDISEVLKNDTKYAENLKINFEKNKTLLSDKNEMFWKIVFARFEEILEICVQSIKLNLTIKDQNKMILMGDGSKILDNPHKDKIFCANDIEFLEETTDNICKSGFKLGMGSNKQEVVVVQKKQIKQGFFEKIFHFFK
ncbi:cell division protein FtsA [Pelagibacteraceae bacterium]|nr:cell division protein FtsA [Pelagibacteraceae bacterium]